MSAYVDLEVPPCGSCFGPAYLGRGATMKCLRCKRSETSCTCRKPAAAEYHVCPQKHFDGENDHVLVALAEAEKEAKLQDLLRRNSVLDLLRREYNEYRGHSAWLCGCSGCRRGDRPTPVLVGKVAGIEMVACTLCGWAAKTDSSILERVKFRMEVS